MEKALKDMRVEEFAEFVGFTPDWRLDEIIASLDAAACSRVGFRVQRRVSVCTKAL